MKTSDKTSSPFILLFWAVPSCKRLKAYKLKSDLLVKAAKQSKSVELLTQENQIVKVNHVQNEAGQFFGLSTMQGHLSRSILNLNTIKTVTLL